MTARPEHQPRVGTHAVFAFQVQKEVACAVELLERHRPWRGCAEPQAEGITR